MRALHAPGNARIPAGAVAARWAWALKDHTISHKAEFIPGSSVQGGDSVTALEFKHS